MEKIYETLTSDTKATIDATIADIKKSVSNENGIDLVLLMATLEQLNELKKKTKEDQKNAKKEILEERKRKAELLGKKYVLTLNVGDMITFRYGSGSCKEATLKLEKVGDKTIQVIYPKEMLPEGSKTSKRNIRFDKIVVPNDFE